MTANIAGNQWTIDDFKHIFVMEDEATLLGLDEVYNGVSLDTRLDLLFRWLLLPSPRVNCEAPQIISLAAEIIDKLDCMSSSSTIGSYRVSPVICVFFVCFFFNKSLSPMKASETSATAYCLH
jgi:hypothetical protein